VSPCSHHPPDRIRNEKAPIYRASLRAFIGRALTTFEAGFALNVIGSFVKGLTPSRASVAGFTVTSNLANPGTRKAPVCLSSAWPERVQHALDFIARHIVWKLLSDFLNDL
jgi:hypothetical protein